MFQTTTLSDIAPGTPPIIPALSPWFQANGGTMFFEGTAPAGGGGVAWQIENGTDTERISLERSGTNVQMRARTASNATLISQTLGTVADGAPVRGAIAFKQGSFKGCVNGGAVFSSTHAGALPAITQTRIGDNVAASSAWPARTRLMYFPYIMSDQQLQTVTSGGWPFVMPTLSLMFASDLYSIYRAERNVSARIAAEMESPQIIPFGAVKFNFPSGVLALNTTPYTISFEGIDFLGVGAMGEISNVEETTEMKSQKVSLKLTGMDPSIISIALGEYYQGTRTKLWLGFLDADHALLDPPMVAFSGQLDTLDITAGQEATIVATIESRFADWERARIRRYTDADQRDIYPNDSGLEFVSKTTEMELVWGRD
jgi:hypothetical protein